MTPADRAELTLEEYGAMVEFMNRRHRGGGDG
jgi:hypothetical protein